MRIQYFMGSVSERQTGGEIYHDEFIRFLSKRHEVHHEADIGEAREGDMISANRFCWTRIKQCQADVIIADVYYSACLVLSNCLVKTWRPSVITIIQAVQEDYTAFTIKNQFSHWICNSLQLRSSDLVIVNSGYTRSRMLSRYRISEEKVKVIYPLAQELERNKFPSSDRDSKTRNILSVANIQPKKGQKVLIEAMRLLKRPGLKLTFVGKIKDRTYYEELLEVIALYGLQDCVSLTGFLTRDALISSYQDADIFVLPSLGEEYGMVIQEAMSFGLPVVASDVGGIPEQITSGVNGILVPPGDAVALSEILSKMLADDKLCNSVGIEARKRAAAFPTWDERWEQFHRVLNKITNYRE